MRLLDLYCGAGGAAAGYHQAGFDEIVGVDIAPQPRYPFRFAQGDALEYLARHGHEFDVIHASPPCQGYTDMNRRWADARDAHPLLIEPVRDALAATGKPYVIENVKGARSAMRQTVMLCGTMFGLEVWRHRYFETWPAHLLLTPSCNHTLDNVPIYGAMDGRLLWRRVDGSELRAPKSLSVAGRAMGIDWMEWDELREAIPPAYTRFIGEQMRCLEGA